MFSRVDAELSKLAETDVHGCSDTELTEAVTAGRRCLERLRALVTRATSEWNQRGVWIGSGAKSASGWIAHECRISAGEARLQVRDARLIRHMPLVRAAWEAGDITVAHVRALEGLWNRRTASAFERDEKLLVDAAKSCGWDEFQAVVRYWEQCADPDGTDEAAEQRRAKRNCHLSESFYGDWYGTFRLDPIGGTIFANVFEQIEEELFEADWKEAKERLGREPEAHELRRTPQQRRADTLVEMARRADAAPPDATPRRPLFVVHVDHETLSGRILELANGTVVTPRDVVPWLADADLQRAVFDACSQIIDLGRRSRLYRGAARQAVVIRDRHCQGFACDTPASRCDVDHIIPWSAGGPTNHDNGRLLCGWHNRQRHKLPEPDPDTDPDPPPQSGAK